MVVRELTVVATERVLMQVGPLTDHAFSDGCASDVAVVLIKHPSFYNDVKEV